MPVREPTVTRFVMALAAAAALQLVYAGSVALVRPAPLVGFVAAVPAVVAVVLGSASAAPALGRRAALWIAVPCAALLVVGVTGVAASSVASVVFVTLCLLAVGCLLGAFVGSRIQHPGHLVVVAYVSSLADLYSVLTPSAPSARIVHSKALLSVLALSWPTPGVSAAAPLLGVADVVMTALYLAAARRHRLGVVRTVVALAAGYAAVFTLVAVTAWPLPALPFLGIAVLCAHRDAWRIPRHERRRAFLGMAVFTVAIATAVWIHA